ncbi:MAG: MraZ protein [Alteromonas macleodii]
MSLSFRGEFNQKVDGKGRMSIPADFRVVLTDGDPRCPESLLPRIVVLHGPHLKNCLHVYTVEAMEEIEDGIKALPRGSDARKRASRMILGKSWDTEVDKDGRIVLPQRLRQQIGLKGEATMAAMGDFFEIWNTETYAEAEAAEAAAMEEEFNGNFDPLSLIDPPEKHLGNI